jgi:hypothetical protein
MTPAANDPASLPDDWPHYREAVLHFGDPVVWSVHVRQLAIGGAVRLRALGLGAPFAVVTAFHPHPERLDHDENLARHAALRRAIARRGLTAVPCAGSSLDGSHREEGLAIACERGDAKELAAEFGQAAFYWWDGMSLWIEPIGLGSTGERILP